MPAALMSIPIAISRAGRIALREPPRKIARRSRPGRQREEHQPRLEGRKAARLLQVERREHGDQAEHDVRQRSGDDHGVERAIAEEARSISGERTRDSIATNTPSSTTPAASVPSVAADSQPQASPRSNARLMQTSAAVIASMPGTSM